MWLLNAFCRLCLSALSAFVTGQVVAQVAPGWPANALTAFSAQSVYPTLEALALSLFASFTETKSNAVGGGDGDRGSRGGIRGGVRGGRGRRDGKARGRESEEDPLIDRS